MNANYKIAIALVAGIAIGGAAIQELHAQAKAKIPGYVVLEIDVSNPEAYAKEFLPIAPAASGGAKYLARGGKTVSIDGRPPASRTVIAVFDSLEKAQAAYTSPEYREARKIGEKYATWRIWATEGLPQEGSQY